LFHKILSFFERIFLTYFPITKTQEDHLFDWVARFFSFSQEASSCGIFQHRDDFLWLLAPSFLYFLHEFLSGS
jgi:hypothetical protein